jgi:outer membrane receptor protein involved in Fe transport
MGGLVTYVLDQGALVLESVTLAAVVKLVVEVLVDLAGGTVLDEETAEDTQAAHPEDLLGHTGIGGTLALTVATVATLSAGKVEFAGTRSRVHRHGLADDEAIGDELSDSLAGVGVGDFALLVGVEPDLALAAADDRGGQALLSSQVDPT